ncbi:alkaline phosphatase D family protein [Aeromonas bestiarum]|uniref:alkaline phosphatase D family protein n=1 Tax=Aeromonas bestiarum TaxID=105751 RepID=UPI0005BC630C|nr:alkaline phosphatase D family protein [Aeromonas bestiarum]
MALVDPRNNEYDVNKLNTGSIVGHVDTDSARIWVRVYKPGKWTLVWSEKKLVGDLISLDEISIEKFLSSQGCNQKNTIQHEFDENSDLCNTFDITNLKPDTTYYYYLMSPNQISKSMWRRTEIGYQKTFSFTTMAQSMPDFSFGFYSCHDPFNANNSNGAWPLFLNRANSAGVRFIIGGGDQIYVDCQDNKYFPDIWEWLQDNKDELIKTYTLNGELHSPSLNAYLLSLYRWYYRVYWKFPHMQEIFSRTPQYMIWDDHEIMDGWGSRTNEERLEILARYFKHDDPEIDQQLVDSMWRAARIAYFEYAHSHNPPTNTTISKLEDPEKCIWDYNFIKGTTPFYVLDLRGHHNVENTRNRLLGDAQVDRFLAWLNTEPVKKSKIVFVVSPVPFVHWKAMVQTAGSLIGSLKDDLMDEWDHWTNHDERDFLLDKIFEDFNAEGRTLVFLSGDVHCAAAFRLQHRTYRKANVFQVTSSAISRMPAGFTVSAGIAKTGTLNGNDNVQFEHIFSHSEDKNFAIFHVRNSSSITVDLCWPGGTEGEAVIKTIQLE